MVRKGLGNGAQRRNILVETGALRERRILAWETGIENTSNPEYNNMQSVGTL